LGAGFQIACTLSLCTQPLDCVHHVRLLCQECVSKVRRPLDVARHPLNHVRKLYQWLDAWVPRLLGHSVRQRFALQILVVIHPLLKLNYFERIGRSGESLRQERIGVQRDRRNQRIELLRLKVSRLLIVRSGCHLLRLRLLRECGGTQRETNDRDYAKNQCAASWLHNFLLSTVAR
jgi:hypothetical protein